MNFITSLILFDILIIIYQILIEVFTILYRINGINVEISKFQVISLLTGTGFTTVETESMMITKKRRHLTQRIMFFSYIFNVSIVSAFVTVFSSTANATKDDLPACITLTLVLILFLILFHQTKTAKKIIDNLVMYIANNKRLKKENFLFVYDTFGNKTIAEIELKYLKTSMRNKTIEEMELKEKYHLQLLVIKRKGQIITDIYPETILQEGDAIVVFGKMKNMKTAFIKPIEKNAKLIAEL